MLLTFILFSCDNSDDIGDLFGMWKLEKITYNGVVTNPSNLFLAFQDRYVLARGSSQDKAYGYYTNTNGEMQMVFYYADEISRDSISGDPNNPRFFLKSYQFYDDGDVTDEEKKLGIKPLHIKFKVESLSPSKMVLTNDDGRWCFTKY